MKDITMRAIITTSIILTHCTTAFQSRAILQRENTICNTQKLVSTRLRLVGNNALEGIGKPSNPGWESG